MTLRLYYHPLASYCWKALIALYEADIPFEREIVDLQDPVQREAFAVDMHHAARADAAGHVAAGRRAGDVALGAAAARDVARARRRARCWW